MPERLLEKPWVPRVLPFGVYMAFIALEPYITQLAPASLSAVMPAFVYAVKTVCVIAALLAFRKSYDELKGFRPNMSGSLLSVAAGAVVFVLWINMDWDFAVVGGQKVFDPASIPDGYRKLFFAVRIFGAAIVVPVFEELFWRSFILRYIINPDFLAVRIGAYTLASFAISSVLFGLEHYLWLAGIMAGAAYNLLLYRTGNLWYPIMAHGVTNFMLGVYVLASAQWRFW